MIRSSGLASESSLGYKKPCLKLNLGFQCELKGASGAAAFVTFTNEGSTKV